MGATQKKQNMHNIKKKVLKATIRTFIGLKIDSLMPSSKGTNINKRRLQVDRND